MIIINNFIIWGFLIILIFNNSQAQSAVTWAEDIAPILYQNCTKCHHSGGAGGFSLVNYVEAASIAGAIKSAVVSKNMPPWPPDPNYSEFAYERRLSDYQINLISQWADAGAPQGNPALAPSPPVYTTEFEITNPDLITTIPVYQVNTSSDLYRCFVIPVNLGAGNRFISEMEIVPGNPSIVHHVLVFADDTNQPLQLDAQDPEPGYTSFGGTGSNNSKLIGGWVPGTRPLKYPNGFGVKISGNTNIIIQVHYPAGTVNQFDSTSIRFKLAQGPGIREVFIYPLINHVTSLTNGPLMILPNEVKTFHAMFTVPGYDVSNLFVAPHMHLIGRSIVCWLVTPSQDSIPVIRINNWNFQWQGFYFHKKLKKVPANSVIYAQAVYDNTTENPFNPNNPPQLVTAGEATTDEMFLIYFGSALYFMGDEHIAIEDQSVSSEPVDFSDIIKSPQLYDLFPNPTSHILNAEGFLPKSALNQFEILDMHGRVVWSQVKELQAGLFSFTIDVSQLSPGPYTLKMISGNNVRTKSVLKN